MAFTDTEKLRIVRLLGWPAKVLDSSSTVYSNTVNDRLTGNSSAAEAEARNILDRLVTLDEKREAALCRASTKEVDGIVLNENELNILSSERKRLLRELSELLDIGLVRRSSAMGNVCA